jgi:predicted transcriptional regulator
MVFRAASHQEHTETLFVSANDYASEALRLMRLHRLDFMPVLEGRQWLGCVFERDMRDASSGTLKEQDVKAFVRACRQ